MDDYPDQEVDQRLGVSVPGCARTARAVSPAQVPVTRASGVETGFRLRTRRLAGPMSFADLECFDAALNLIVYGRYDSQPIPHRARRLGATCRRSTLATPALTRRDG